MSMHDSVMELFKFQDNTEVTLTNTDVNRIVTNVVRNFSLKESATEQIEFELASYISRYKRPVKRDCGCSKK